jgi:hypothetical protein
MANCVLTRELMAQNAPSEPANKVIDFIVEARDEVTPQGISSADINSLAQDET